jgi:type II restriction enzyme
MFDLALSGDPDTAHGMYLVAPDAREDEVRAQIRRHAFSRVATLKVRYLPYGELRAHREAIMRLGQGLHPIEALARDLH